MSMNNHGVRMLIQGICTDAAEKLISNGIKMKRNEGRDKTVIALYGHYHPKIYKVTPTTDYNETLQFFRSEWFETLTGFDSEFVIRGLMDRLEEEFREDCHKRDFHLSVKRMPKIPYRY